MLLHFLNQWQPLDSLKEFLPDFSDEELSESIEGLVEVGGLVVQGSEDEGEEKRKVESWEWGIPSAMLHYAEQNKQYLPVEAAEALQRERSRKKPTPELFTRNDAYQTVHALDRPLGNNSVLDLMARRRTNRDVSQTPVPLEVLSDCLFAGLGITSSAHNCITELPLSMTPSGGARNPYEAYVYAPRVSGLDAGIYHYSAKEHSLGLVSKEHIEDPASLVGDQKWINDMSAIIFLCADFSRTMWKYQDNNAYRVVLIEAGHIGQNIMLAATENGLTACPSAALAHSQISDHLELDNDLKSPIYALMIGSPLASKFVADLH